LQQVIGRLVTAQSDLQDERQINRALQQNQTAWQSKFQALEKEFNEYKIDKDKVNIMFVQYICKVLKLQLLYVGTGSWHCCTW